MAEGPKPLVPAAGGSGGFSFPKHIQPILDKHCVSCHNREKLAAKKTKLSLEGTGTLDGRAKKLWTDADGRESMWWIAPSTTARTTAY